MSDENEIMEDSDEMIDETMEDSNNISDERVEAIISAINNLNSGLDVTNTRVRNYLEGKSWLENLKIEIIAQIFVDAQVEVQALEAQAQAAQEQAAQAQAALEQEKRHSHRSVLLEQRPSLLPPAVAETTASSLNNDPQKGATYAKNICPDDLYENAFVHVKSYFRFVKGCAKASTDGRVPKKEAQDCFGSHKYKTWCPHENKRSRHEKKRSIALCRAFGKELRDEQSLDVQHRTPIVPTQEKLNQEVDVCFFVQSEKIESKEIGGVKNREKIIAQLEYKPNSLFESFEKQACAYGTDLMNIDNTPIIIIQAYGTTLSVMEYRAFGIVPKIMAESSESGTVSNHRKVLLFEGEGLGGFAAIAEGLRHCVAGLKQDGSFETFKEKSKVSSVASVHKIDGKWLFIKSYDYRLRSGTATNNRRQANLSLVQGWIDKDAEYFKLGKHLEVVISHFYEQKKGQTEWYAPFPVENLGLVLKALADLHEQNYVHGDIRLFNFLLHEGKLVDFDHTREAGSYYPNTLQQLGVDGDRAKAVSEAIDDGKLSTLEMKFAHDLESMMYALKRLQPTAGAPKNFADWWKREVSQMSDFHAVLGLQKDITEKFSDESNKLEFDASIKDHLQEFASKP